jgi:hypothetical protein
VAGAGEEIDVATGRGVKEDAVVDVFRCMFFPSLSPTRRTRRYRVLLCCNYAVLRILSTISLPCSFAFPPSSFSVIVLSPFRRRGAEVQRWRSCIYRGRGKGRLLPSKDS